MKKFAFISKNSVKEYYDFLLNKQKNNKLFLDVIKISGLAGFFVLCTLIYLRFVSLSSTE
jgi:hypothetical protein